MYHKKKSVKRDMNKPLVGNYPSLLACRITCKIKSKCSHSLVEKQRDKVSYY